MIRTMTENPLSRLVSTVSSRITLAAAAFAIAIAALGTPAYAADRTVAVLYFDNGTGDSQYDVFQKGLADMMITDLATVPGVTVVERDHLQALLDEIALQKTSYFDQRTAVKVGKGLGARYAVTGAIHAVKPVMRIDMRMIDVASGQVVVTSKVTGPDSDIFRLEQQLVKEFVQGMNKRFSPSRQARTRVPDADVLLEYSKALDLADQGRWEAASQHMRQVVSSAPSFVLARVKREEFVKRLEAAGTRRRTLLNELNAALAKKAQAYLDAHDIQDLDDEESAHYLAYGALRGRFIIALMEREFTISTDKTLKVFQPGRDARGRALMEAYYSNLSELLQAHRTREKKFPRYQADGSRTRWSWNLRLPDEADAKTRKLDIRKDFPKNSSEVARELGEFLLLGRVTPLTGRFGYWLIAHPLAERDPAYKKLGYRYFQQAVTLGHQLAQGQPNSDNAAIEALNSYADALFLRGKRELGIARLQEVLDRYPTSRYYKRQERILRKKLGLQRDTEEKKRTHYAKLVKQCDNSMDLRHGLHGALERHFHLYGWKGITAVVKEVETACQNATAKIRERVSQILYRTTALYTGKRGNCASFETFMGKFVAHGGSASSVASYRKNYTKCPVP